MKGLFDISNIVNSEWNVMQAVLESLKLNEHIELSIFCQAELRKHPIVIEFEKQNTYSLISENNFADGYDFFISDAHKPDIFNSLPSVIAIAILHGLKPYYDGENADFNPSNYRYWEKYDYYVSWYDYLFTNNMINILKLTPNKMILYSNPFNEFLTLEVEQKFIVENAHNFNWAFIQEIKQRMKEQPLVTIITITFNLILNNREKTIRKCIESVNKQSYNNIEHIIIDGASSDGTLDLLCDYENKGWIKVFSEPDEGVYDAMNKGIEKANGEYIAFLNSDDSYCDFEAVEYIIKAFKKTDAIYVFGNANCIAEDGSCIPWVGNLQALPYAGNYCHQTLFVKTDIMRKLGGFNTSYKVSSDSDIMIRLFKEGYDYCAINKTYIEYNYGGLSGVSANQSQLDHAHSFFIHIGKDLGLTYGECTEVWQLHFLNSRPLVQQIRILENLGKSFSLEFPLVEIIRRNSTVQPHSQVFGLRYHLKEYLKRKFYIRSKVLRSKYRIYFLFKIIPFFIKKV